MINHGLGGSHFVTSPCPVSSNLAIHITWWGHELPNLGDMSLTCLFLVNTRGHNQQNIADAETMGLKGIMILKLERKKHHLPVKKTFTNFHTHKQQHWS